jgi:hypothetical protein
LKRKGGKRQIYEETRKDLGFGDVGMSVDDELHCLIASGGL